jgi:hypothetical protein
LSIVWNSKQIENTTFWKLDLFLSSGEGRETPILLGPSFNRLNRVGASLHSPEGGNRNSFWNPKQIENRIFWKLALFLSSGEVRETPSLLGPSFNGLNRVDASLHSPEGGNRNSF